MEPIPSGEVFPNVELTQGEAPRHTQPEHEACAYYGELECTHGAPSAGGFYSEDFVNDLRAAVHELIGFMDKNVEIKMRSWSMVATIERRNLDFEQARHLEQTIEHLTELTK